MSDSEKRVLVEARRCGEVGGKQVSVMLFDSSEAGGLGAYGDPVAVDVGLVHPYVDLPALAREFGCAVEDIPQEVEGQRQQVMALDMLVDEFKRRESALREALYIGPDDNLVEAVRELQRVVADVVGEAHVHEAAAYVQQLRSFEDELSVLETACEEAGYPKNDPVSAIRHLRRRVDDAEGRVRRKLAARQRDEAPAMYRDLHRALMDAYRPESHFALDPTNPAQFVGAVIRSNVRAEQARAQEADARADEAEQEAQRQRERAEKAEAEMKAAWLVAKESERRYQRIADEGSQAEIERLRSEVKHWKGEHPLGDTFDRLNALLDVERDAVTSLRAENERLRERVNEWPPDAIKAHREQDAEIERLRDHKDEIERAYHATEQQRRDLHSKNNRLREENGNLRAENERLREERRGGCETHEPISTPGCVVCQMEEAERLRAEIERLRERVQECEGEPYAADPSRWPHADLIEGLSRQRADADREIFRLWAEVARLNLEKDGREYGLAEERRLRAENERLREKLRTTRRTSAVDRVRLDALADLHRRGCGCGMSSKCDECRRIYAVAVNLNGLAEARAREAEGSADG